MKKEDIRAFVTKAIQGQEVFIAEFHEIIIEFVKEVKNQIIGLREAQMIVNVFGHNVLSTVCEYYVAILDITINRVYDRNGVLLKQWL